MNDKNVGDIVDRRSYRCRSRNEVRKWGEKGKGVKSSDMLRQPQVGAKASKVERVEWVPGCAKTPPTPRASRGGE